MTLRLYGEDFQKKDSKKISFEEKKDYELNEFLEMGLHEQKKIVDTIHYEIVLLRIIGGFMYLTRDRNNKAVSSIFVSEKDLEKKMKIEEE